jgi:hypothetical protein
MAGNIVFGKRIYEFENVSFAILDRPVETAFKSTPTQRYTAVGMTQTVPVLHVVSDKHNSAENAEARCSEGPTFLSICEDFHFANGSGRLLIPPTADAIMCSLHAGILIAHQLVDSCRKFGFQRTFISVLCAVFSLLNTF